MSFNYPIKKGCMIFTVILGMYHPYLGGIIFISSSRDVSSSLLNPRNLFCIMSFSAF